MALLLFLGVQFFNVTVQDLADVVPDRHPVGGGFDADPLFGLLAGPTDKRGFFGVHLYSPVGRVISDKLIV